MQHTIYTGQRTVPAEHSDNWLDQTAITRESPIGHIPEGAWADWSDHLNGSISLDDSELSDFERRLTEEEARHSLSSQDPFVDLTNEPSSPATDMPLRKAGLKRSAAEASFPTRPTRSSQRTKRSPVKAEGSVEEMDLTNEAPSAEEELLQSQQEQTIKSQQADTETNGPLKIGKRQCIICMENFTNATVTHCGHIYCHECLTQALKASEKNSHRGGGNCPVCRKPVNRTKANQMIPISFMKKSAFEGKSRRT